jgi:putative pyruvate formate lyase activating enzyme
LIDIYMPDMKFSDSAAAEKLCSAADYPEVNFAAVREMHRQVGDLVIKDEVAVRGLLVRHLVLPEDMAGSLSVIDFLSQEISSNTIINVMGQYRPCYKASMFEKINRRPTVEEIENVRTYARQKGLRLSD